MITTKAFITKIPEEGSNMFQVRVPLMEDNTQSEALFDALLCNSSNSEFNNYHVGDCVFVDFEDDKYNTAIILGKLYTEQKEESTSYNVINNLKVTGAATLPEDTIFGNKYSVRDFFSLYQGGTGGGGTGTINPEDLKQYVQWKAFEHTDPDTQETEEWFGNRLMVMSGEEFDKYSDPEQNPDWDDNVDGNTFFFLSSPRPSEGEDD